MEWLKQQGPWSPGADQLPADEPSAVRRADFLHLSVCDDGDWVSRSIRPAACSCRRPTTSRRFGSRSTRTCSPSRPPSCSTPRSSGSSSRRSSTSCRLSRKPSASASTSRNTSRTRACRCPSSRSRRTTRPRAGDDETAVREFPSHLTARGAVFRRRHRLYGPIALYGGRIDPGKGCEELIEYFSRYVKAGGDATLALMGVKLMALPEEPFINFAGLLSDRERLQALEAATVVICPSPYESLSLLALEALSVGTPILVNGRSPVLVEHCVSSNGGLYYADGDEFVECLKLLVRDDRLRAEMGRNGREYVRRNYRWDVVLGKYERVFAKIRSAR